MVTPAEFRPAPSSPRVRLTAACVGLAAGLAMAGDAVAAANWVPRMEQVARCDWDRPGHNPFMGDVVAAIDRYTEIPTPVRMRLKQRMQTRNYDDLVDIRRDSIAGRHQYEPTIRDMHFGLDRVCRQVSRNNWTAKSHERGLVYCESGHCILVPTVCRNVSRIGRRPSIVAAAQEAASPDRETAMSSPAAGAGTPPSGASSTAIAVAPSRIGDSRIPAGPSFSDGVAGAALPLWPTGSATPSPGGGTPSSGDGAGGVPSQPAPGGTWLVGPSGGGGVPIYFSPGGSTVGGNTDSPGRGSRPGGGSLAGGTAATGGTTPDGSGTSADRGTTPGAGTPAGGGTLGGGDASGGGGNGSGGGTPGGGTGGGPILIGAGGPIPGGVVGGALPGDPASAGTSGGPILIGGGEPILGGLLGGALPGDPASAGNGGGPILIGAVGGGEPTLGGLLGGAGNGTGLAPVSPVPEPSTWITLLIGLAAVIGATARRRRASVNA